MPGPKDLSAEEIEALTPEEFEALNDDTILDEGEAGDDGVVAVIPDEQNTLLGGKDKPVAEDKEDPAPEPQPTPPPAPDTTAAPPAEPPAAASTFQLPAARDFAAEDAAISAKQAALSEKFDAGDITSAEFISQSNAITRELTRLEIARDTHERANADLETQFFQQALPKFLADHPAYAPGSIRHAALNTVVMDLQNQAIAAAGGDERAQFDPKFLQMAFDKIEKELGGTSTRRPAGIERELPPSLSGLPAGDGADDITTNSRWAALDRLANTDPGRHEEELAKLSEADQNAYLAAR